MLSRAVLFMFMMITPAVAGYEDHPEPEKDFQGHVSYAVCGYDHENYCYDTIYSSLELCEKFRPSKNEWCITVNMPSEK